MPRLTMDITMSLDGYVAGPNMRPGVGLGDGAERLHAWAFGAGDDADSEVLEEMLSAPGAFVMGRRMFGGEGPWDNPAWGDVPWEGWWGDDPQHSRPVFVLTHHEREPLHKSDTTFTFVTDGIQSALEQARAAAGDRDVALGGGADVAQQYLRAGLLDELQIHLAPILLGRGVRLFEGLDVEAIGFEPIRVIHSQAVTHVRYRVVT
jgi:dihydrofolate reductase